MNSFLKLACLMGIITLTSGCFYSEQQLGTEANMTRPFKQDVTYLAYYEMEDGEWVEDEGLILKQDPDSLGYFFLEELDDPAKDRVFFIDLKGMYLASESTEDDGNFLYAFFKLKRKILYQYDTFADEFMDPITSDEGLQQELGVTCDSSACEVSTIAALNKIMAYALEQGLEPVAMYTVKKQN